MIERGSISWADLGSIDGSRRAKRRPVLVIQADSINESRISTAIVAVITSNTSAAAMPGNVFLPLAASGLPRDSVVNVTSLVKLNKADLDPALGLLSTDLQDAVNQGLRRVLDI